MVRPQRGARPEPLMAMRLLIRLLVMLIPPSSIAWVLVALQIARYRCRIVSSRSSSGPPSWTMRPFSMTTHASAVCSAKSIFCSTSRTAIAAAFDDVGGSARRSPARCWAGCPRTARRAAAPWAGRTARGRWPASAAGRPTGCRRPAPAARAGSESARKSPREPWLRAAPAGARVPSSRFSRTRELGEDAATLRHIADAEAGDAVRRQAGEQARRPARRGRGSAARGRSGTRISVVLPTPLRPSSASTSPSASARSTPFSTGTRP